MFLYNAGNLVGYFIVSVFIYIYTVESRYLARR